MRLKGRLLNFKAWISVAISFGRQNLSGVVIKLHHDQPELFCKV